MPQMQMLDLELLINSRYPFIAVTTDEEDRLQDMLRRLAVRLAIPFYVWTPVEGLIRPPLKELASPHDRQPLQALAQVAASREDGLYLFKDLHKFLGDPAVVRRLHDLAPVLSRGRRALILTACDLDLPPKSGRCRRCSSWSCPRWRNSRPWCRTGSASSVPGARSGST